MDNSVDTSAGATGALSLPLPVFEYAEPRRFFKQFRRYASLKNLSGVVALDLICYALGSCRRAAWVADRVEAEVQAAERDATVSAAEQKVLHLLTPEVMKGQILQGLDQRRLQPGETPREYVEALKSQIQQVMPELTAESLDRMTIVQAIKGAPEAWSHKLGEGDLSSLDQLVTHMTLLHGKQRSAARRCQETGRSEVREPAATVCRCVVTDGAVEDFEDSLDEEVMPFLDQVKTQADLSHLSTVDQEKLKAVLDQSDVVRAVGLTDLTRRHSFEWTEAAERSFQDLRKAVAAFPVVRPPDPEQPFRITTDASSQDATMESGTNDSEEDDDDTGGQVSMRNLPDEILDHLLTFVLPYDDMQSCKLVSHRWYHAVKRVEQKLCRLLARSLDELNVAWFHYDTPNLVGSPLPAAAHRVITKRCAHSAAMLDGRMYVFGGCSSRMTSFNDLWWLELGELEWRRPQVVGSYPSPKAYASMVAYGDKLVLFGGWSQAAPYPLHQSWKLFDEMHIYDTKECRWEEVCGVSSTERVVGLPGAPPPLAERWPPKMARHAASVHGHQMVVTGGLHHLHSRHFGATNEVWVYDFVSGEWRHQRCSQPAPPPRYGHSQVALDERHMLLLGGSGGPKQLKQDIWLLELGEPNAVWHWHQLTVNGAERAPSQLWCHPACPGGRQGGSAR
ncbi:F-box only protein 42 [Amphibalanus amphitrite]|uniref:F-box only protein 42 n=1 Tax=Amphibalanus amphitrite TaxID=1232801 RepID=A0A6A4X985_AMPAM|nr:F-box only protein 42 [Amphibalanus amphitrite]KAF0312554.1 F-box only protein 42 [Amphibalanus amphitrite]